MQQFQISGTIVDILNQEFYPATLSIANGIITKISRLAELPDHSLGYILPGFIDSHVHIESSMLIPSEFARLAVVHGTVATVSDPHEIANVCGIEGVEFMIDNGNTVPFKFNFGAPSCVPATTFETAGATLDATAVESLLQRKEIRYLSEMMNFPGVLHKDEEVMKKIAAAHKHLKPVDGHAPGLRGDTAKQYMAAGITTDHECFTKEEALDKLQSGMKILIREGSAARNFDALIELLQDYPNQIMFCSDDKHPDSLLTGHINDLCARALKNNIPLFNILKAACINPVLHYNLEVGLLREGDPADFIITHNLASFEVHRTYINGQLVAQDGVSLIKRQHTTAVNNFNCSPKSPEDFLLHATDTQPPLTSHHDPLSIAVIEALDGQLITNNKMMKGKIENGHWVPDVTDDILKIVVVNRYHHAPVSIAFIHGFGLKEGAIASSVAHDSHNIVAVGIDDNSIADAVNLVISSQGGVSLATWSDQQVLPLPVAGLMSLDDGYEVAQRYALIDAAAKALGSPLGSPFMTLSFMALLVIPHLKLSDKGLFDGDKFKLLV